MDLQFLIFVFPAGVVLCFQQLRDEHVFVIIYAVMASYFAGVMVRLMLTLTPVVCVASAIAFSTLLDTYLDAKEPDDAEESTNVASPPSDAQASASKKNNKPAKPAAATHGNALKDLVAAADKTKSKGIYGLDTRLAIIMNAIG